MPFISDREAIRVRDHISHLRTRLHHHVHHHASNVRDTAEVVGSAAVVGWAEGQLQGRGRSFQVFGFDAALVAGTVLGVGSTLKWFGRYDRDAMRAAQGTLAYYIGKKAFEMGVTAGQQGKLLAT